MFSDKNKILKAIDKNKLNKVEKLMIKYKNNYSHEKHYTEMCSKIIYKSIYCDGNDMINLLLKHIDLSSRNEMNSTVFMEVIEYYQPENIIESDNFNEKILFMLNHMNDINGYNSYDLAIERYITFIIEYSYDYGYDLLNDSSKNVIIKMLDLNADIFEINGEGHDTMSTVLSSNRFDILYLILKHKRYNNNKFGIDVIISALADNCDYDIFELLVSHIDNINAKSEYGTIKKYIKKIKYNNSDVIELLVMHGLRL